MAKKEISSWKQKSMYKIIAPGNFDSQELGTTLSSDPKKVVGRRIDVSLTDLTGDRTKKHLTVVFEVTEVKGDRALTKFRAFQANKGYIHSKVRGGMSKVDYVGNLKLDNSEVRVKIMAVTHHNIQTSQKKEILRRIGRSVDGYKNANLDDFIQATLFGKIGTGIYHNTKTVCPVRRVEIEEVKVV